MSWNPLHDSLLSSSILSEGPDVVAVWAIFIASANRYGVSDVTIPFVASMLRISDERAEEAFRVLSSPDPKSRNKASQGRRIMPEGDGWFVVSHAKYREKASKESAARRQAEYRDRKKTETCERVGCAKKAEAAVEGLRVCSEHAFGVESRLKREASRSGT